MATLATIAPALLARARADQVATLYAHGHLTSWSMGLGALILCAAMWNEVALKWMVIWCALIALNQLWRAALVHAYRRIRPGADATPRWGRYWATGSALAGSLWGAAGVTMFPEAPAHQALLIVCLFGAALGGLNLTAVYKPSFYGFVLPALVPLIVRVALVGDPVHFLIAGVTSVVLAFVIGFGHQLNDVLTRSLVIRYENVDLIDELKLRTRSAVDARAAAESANRAKSQLLAAASHDLRQPLHALGLYVAALSARAREAEWRPLVDHVESAAGALEMQFAQLIDLSRLDAGVLVPERAPVPLGPLFTREFGAKGLEILAAYRRAKPNLSPYLIQAEAFTDRTRGNSMRQAERKAALNRAPAYMYVWDWATPAFGGKFGAVHGHDDWLGCHDRPPRAVPAKTVPATTGRQAGWTR